MLRVGFVGSIALAVFACESSSDDGGSSGSGSSGSAGQSGNAGADGGGSAGQSGSSGQAGRGGSAATGGSAGGGGRSGGAGRGGSSGASGSGKVCGGIAGLTCDEGDWCDYPDHCGEGDMQGVCRPKPNACTKDCPGVCGCDGNSHCNACIAQQQGVDVSPTASCSDAGASGACTSDDDCSRGLKCCYPCGVPDCSNRCMAPDSNGDCPLFP